MRHTQIKESELYPRRLALLDIPSTKLKVGTRVNITELNDAVYEVVEPTETQGFIKYTLIDGKRLRLVHNSVILASHFGFKDDDSDNTEVVRAMVEYCNTLPKSVFLSPIYTLLFDSCGSETSTGRAAVYEDYSFSGNYNVRMDVNLRREGATPSIGAFIDIGFTSDVERLFYRGTTHKINISTTIKWDGTEGYCGSKISNIVRSVTDYYRVDGFEVGNLCYARNAPYSYNKANIYSVRNNRVGFSLLSYNPQGAVGTPSYVTSCTFSIVGLIGTTSDALSLDYDRYAFIIDATAHPDSTVYTTEDIKIRDGVIEGLGSMSVNREGLVALVRRGADIKITDIRDEKNRIFPNSPSVINAFSGGGGITYQPSTLLPLPVSLGTLIQMPSGLNTSLVNCRASSPMVTRRLSSYEDDGRRIIKANIVDDLVVSSTGLTQSHPLLYTANSSGTESSLLDSRFDGATASIEDGSFKVLSGVANLAFEIDTRGVSHFLIKLEQSREAPFSFWYRLLDENRNPITDVVLGDDIGGYGMSTSSTAPYDEIDGVVADFYKLRADVIGRSLYDRYIKVSDRVAFVKCIMRGTEPDATYTQTYSLLKSLEVIQVYGHGRGGVSGLSGRKYNLLTATPLDSGNVKIGSRVYNKATVGRTGMGWEYGVDGWEEFGIIPEGV